MKCEYIYVLSNKSLHKNVLKIGFTTKHPNKRALHLSRSTSIPTDFKVEHFKEVSNKRVIETRVHLILSEFRVSNHKEFFQVTLESAIKAIDLAIDYTDNHEGESEKIRLDDDFISRIESPPLKANSMNVLYLMMASTTYNTVLDAFIGDFEIEHGFISSFNYSKITKKNISTSNRVLREFCKKYSGLVVYIGEDKAEIKVFEAVKYSKGQCMWLFSKEYRRLFTNDKITHLL